MEIKQIRMGIVGAGTWGRTHASIYAEHLFADPVAICDMNEARAREIADEFGIRKVYTDYHVYLRLPRIHTDLVSSGTVNSVISKCRYQPF